MLYLHNIINSFWCLKPEAVDAYMPLVLAYMKGNKIDMPKQEKKMGVQLHSQAVPFIADEYHLPKNVTQDSIAIIPIEGVITKHDQFCGPLGMATQSNLLKQCYANDKIKNVVIFLETCGGEAYASLLMRDTINMRNKPVLAFVSDYCHSGGVMISTSCDYTVANSNIALFGSIGTMNTIYDYREKLKKEGIDIKDFYATASKDKNSVYRDAVDGKPEELIKQLDIFNEEFLSGVEKGRGAKLKKDRSVWGTGKEYFAKEALELGLIDEISSFDNVLDNFLT